MKPNRRAITTALLASALGLATLSTRDAHAQIGTGGVTGTGTFASTDMFLSVQKKEGTNLNQRDQSRYLNHAHCVCDDPVWVKAIVLPAAAGRALAIDPTATVSAYVGSSCDNSTLRPGCLRLGSTQMSQFRVQGLTAKTTVGALARYRIQGGSTASGGASGTGGAGGSGDAGGSGGMGSGGADGTGGATITPTNGACDSQFTQTFWILIGTAGEGDSSLGQATLGMLMDVQAPTPPTLAVPEPVHEALTLSWPAIKSSDVADLLGYQVLCTRDEYTQVFENGTFDPAFDSCANETNGDPPVPWPRPNGTFVCSDLLPPAQNTYRLKILENKIQYKVALAAIDKQGNASVVTPQYGTPVLTQDFYYVYRHSGQGSAEGGFCAVAEGRTTGLGVLGGLGLVVTLGLVVRARRRSRRQP